MYKIYYSIERYFGSKPPPLPTFYAFVYQDGTTIPFTKSALLNNKDIF